MWRGYPVEGYYNARWLMGLWSTQVKVEGIVLKAEWHWDSDSGAVNDPFWEPGCTAMYVSLPSLWGFVDGDYVFPHFVGGLLKWGLRHINE